jgi:hypothetical protein
MGRWLLALALVFAVAAHSQAQVARQLPANGKLGDLVGGKHVFPLVQIGGKVARLTPGARIWDQDNRTIVHGALPERAPVLFVQEPNGDVSRIYILRPEELELVKSRSKR